MARTLYGHTGGDIVAAVDAQGDFVPATATFTAWTTRTGGTQLTSLQTVALVNTTSITPDASGRIMFYGPDPYTAEIWLRNEAATSAARYLVNPVDLASRVVSGGGTGGVTDHGLLTGLVDDDHPQYLMIAEGDARYPVLDGTGKVPAANLPAASTGKFGFIANVPGELTVGEALPGGVPFVYDETIGSIIANVNLEPRGANLVVAAVKRTGATGVESTIATLTITAGTGKRAASTGLTTSMVVGDRLFFRVTSVGVDQAGSDLLVRVAGTTAIVPATLAAPSNPTGATTVASGANVVLTWTAPTGVFSAVDIYKEGSFFARVLKGTNTYTDLDATADAHSYVLRANNNDAVSSGTTLTYTPAAAGIANPVKIGTGTTTATVASVAVSLTAGAAVGENVVVLVAAAGAEETWSATDSRGNAYVSTVVGGSAVAGTTTQCAILRAKVTTALLSGDTITVTGSSTRVRTLGYAYKVAGLNATAPLDKVQSNTENTIVGKNWTTTATAALAVANEVAFAVFCVLDQNNATPGAGWNMGVVLQTTALTNDRTLIPMWQKPSGTAALTGTATGTLSSKYAGAIATFKPA